jgi:hypothetical protein
MERVMASHDHNHSKHRHEEKGGPNVWKPHKDWRVWVALLLMLAAILAYVLSLDDSIIPR